MITLALSLLGKRATYLSEKTVIQRDALGDAVHRTGRTVVTVIEDVLVRGKKVTSIPGPVTIDTYMVQPLRLLALRLSTAFISALQTYVYLTSAGEGPVRAHGSALSSQPRGIPL